MSKEHSFVMLFPGRIPGYCFSLGIAKKAHPPEMRGPLSPHPLTAAGGSAGRWDALSAVGQPVGHLPHGPLLPLAQGPDALPLPRPQSPAPLHPPGWRDGAPPAVLSLPYRLQHHIRIESETSQVSLAFHTQLLIQQLMEGQVLS